MAATGYVYPPAAYPGVTGVPAVPQGVAVYNPATGTTTTTEITPPADPLAVHKGAAWTGSVVSIIALILAILALLFFFFLTPPSGSGKWYRYNVATSSLGASPENSTAVPSKNRTYYVVNPGSNTNASNVLRFTGGSQGNFFGVINTSNQNNVEVYYGTNFLGSVDQRSAATFIQTSSSQVVPVRGARAVDIQTI